MMTGGFGGAITGIALGEALPDIPQAVGKMHSLPSVKGGNPLTRHGMDQVIDGIEAQKESDIRTLESYLGET